jgi:proline iminopeptidase
MTVAVDGAELSYSVRGSGPACLVLSVVGTAPYERQMPGALSEHLRLVFVDLRGCGRSTGDPGDLTFDRLAADLEAIRVDLGVDRVVVLGHSILGVLAIEYARRCPATVSHVITVGTPPRGDLVWLTSAATVFFEQDASTERKAILQENLAGLPAEPSFEQAILARTPTRFFDPRIDAAPLYEGAIVTPSLLARSGVLTKDWDATIDPSGLQMPILLAHGRYDYTVPYVLWDGLVSKLPNATFQIFERSGHQPFCEEPERFVEIVTSWMNSTR